MFEEVVLFKGTHTWRLYCLRVLTRGVFEEVLYEERVFGESLHGRRY